MTISTPVPPAQILAQAEAAFAGNEHRRGARLAYQAALQAAAEAAARDNFPCKSVTDAKAYLKSLDPALDLDAVLSTFSAITAAYNARQSHPNGDCRHDLLSVELPPSPLHIELFGIAESFREHADTPLEIQAALPERYWQLHEYAAYLAPVRELIAMLASRSGQRVADD